MAERRVVTVKDAQLAKRYAKGLVSVIDDDASILTPLRELIEYEGYACETFNNVAAFFEQQVEDRFPGPRCILTDMCMPGGDGLSLQSALPVETDQIIVFMSGISNVDQVAQAFRQGAIHFLTKPVDDETLFATIHEALLASTERQRNTLWRERQLALVAELTPRELEVARLIPSGLPIKVMADQLGVSDRAIKLYKQSLMEKLELDSAYDLARLQNEGLL